MRKFFIGFILLALSGCTAITTFSSAVGDLFSDADNAEPPAELTEYQPEIKLEILWDKDDGVGTDGLAMNLVPAIADGVLLSLTTTV